VQTRLRQARLQQAQGFVCSSLDGQMSELAASLAACALLPGLVLGPRHSLRVALPLQQAVEATVHLAQAVASGVAPDGDHKAATQQLQDLQDSLAQLTDAAPPADAAKASAPSGPAKAPRQGAHPKPTASGGGSAAEGGAATSTAAPPAPAAAGRKGRPRTKGVTASLAPLGAEAQAGAAPPAAAANGAPRRGRRSSAAEPTAAAAGDGSAGGAVARRRSSVVLDPEGSLSQLDALVANPKAYLRLKAGRGCAA
jgi:hypothetical protein